MRRCIMVGLTVLTLLVGGIQPVHADSPLTLEYVVTDLGNGLYQYDFNLYLDNHSGTWSPGQGFGWFIFGDAKESSSPLQDFQMDPSQFPIGPWTSLSSSGGYHNGPTFAFVLDTWVPSDIGDSLQWSGVSAVFLDQGDLLFSSIYTSGGAPIIEFEVATLVSP